MIENNKPSICFATVSFNNPDAINAWIRHIQSLANNCHIVVSDNSTDEGASKKIQGLTRELGVAYISEDLNTGYFSGLNRAINSSRNHDFFVLGNSDITYDEDFITTLEQINPESYDIIAPKIKTETNADLNPYMTMREPVLERIVLKLKFSSYLCYLAYAAFYKIGIIPMIENLKGKPQQTTQDIWAAHGACFIISKSYLDKCHQLPVKTFLWLEENILALYAQRHSARTTYFPSLQTKHEGRATTSKMPRIEKYRIKKESFNAYTQMLNEYNKNSKTK